MIDKRRDLLDTYGPYNQPSLLLKVLPDAPLTVRAFDGTSVVVTSDVRHAGGSVLDPSGTAYLVLKHAGGLMVRTGGGSIVAVSSMQAVQPAPMFAAYCAAKAGLEMLVRCAAEELGHHRIRVNAVRPGLTRTDATTGMFADDDVMTAYLDQQPIDRPGEADDVAGAIRYFCGPESSWTTGQCLSIDGGTTLRRFPVLDDWYRSRLGEEIDRAERGEVD
jgi:NAD(P)-dependent dehydrogenase (short-subunit alcohol dehydrogenase family)